MLDGEELCIHCRVTQFFKIQDFYRERFGGGGMMLEEVLEQREVQEGVVRRRMMGCLDLDDEQRSGRKGSWV